MKRCTTCGHPIGAGNLIVGDINKCEDCINLYEENPQYVEPLKQRIREQVRESREEKFGRKKAGWR